MTDNMTTFDSTKESLQDVLRSVRDGKTQLPDFQRSWVWDDARIKGLLASISMSYPIGAVMMLQTGNPSVRLHPRRVEGVVADEVIPERLILDGQQRLTSLYQALFLDGPAKTRDLRNKEIERYYYVDLERAFEPGIDREDAIVALPPDRIVRNFRGDVLEDYSTTEKECAGGRFPLSVIFDISKLTAWQMTYLQVDPTNIGARLQKWNRLLQELVQRFQQYQVPLIVLRKETAKAAVCRVFEKVNTGGVALTVFELLTSTFAADDFRLRDDWQAREKRLRSFRSLKAVESSDFLQAVTLLATFERSQAVVSCKREDILDLTLDEYRRTADKVSRGLEGAAKFLHLQRIFAARDIPYRTQLIPISAILAVLGDDAETDTAKRKLAQWFWCGVFGELYGSAIETRFAKDLPQVVAWIRGDPNEPDTVRDSNFLERRLTTLRSRNSAAYKGLAAVLLRDGALDFRTGDPVDVQMYFDERIDIHHIYPKAYCQKIDVGSKRYNSIVNKTPISARTNRIIGGNAPSVYLQRVETRFGISKARLDEILTSHVVDPQLLRNDEFDAFFSARAEALLQRVEQAMGKPVQREVVAIEIEDVEDDEDDEEVEEIAS